MTIDLRDMPFNYEPLLKAMKLRKLSFDDLKRICDLKDETIEKIKGNMPLSIRTISKICIYMVLDISEVVEINFGYAVREYRPKITTSSTLGNSQGGYIVETEELPNSIYAKPTSYDPVKERDSCKLFKNGECAGMKLCNSCADYESTVPVSEQEKDSWPGPSMRWWK